MLFIRITKLYLNKNDQFPNSKYFFVFRDFNTTLAQQIIYIKNKRGRIRFKVLTIIFIKISKLINAAKYIMRDTY